MSPTEDKRFTFLTWAIGLIATTLVAISVAGVPWAYSVHGRLSRVAVIVELVLVNQTDIIDLRNRITSIESRGILPDAERRITKLEERVRQLEQRAVQP